MSYYNYKLLMLSFICRQTIALRWRGICISDTAVCLSVSRCVYHVDILCQNN